MDFLSKFFGEPQILKNRLNLAFRFYSQNGWLKIKKRPILWFLLSLAEKITFWIFLIIEEAFYHMKLHWLFHSLLYFL